MRVVAAEDYLAVGVRCTGCHRFVRVVEGAAIPRCPAEGCADRAGQTLEHHTRRCVEACWTDCPCPCHEYRPREGVR